MAFLIKLSKNAAQDAPKQNLNSAWGKPNVKSEAKAPQAQDKLDRGQGGQPARAPAGSTGLLESIPKAGASAGADAVVHSEALEKVLNYAVDLANLSLAGLTSSKMKASNLANSNSTLKAALSSQKLSGTKNTKTKASLALTNECSHVAGLIEKHLSGPGAKSSDDAQILHGRMERISVSLRDAILKV